jgi:hypothetical protein
MPDPEIDYVNLDVEIERTADGGYRVCVPGSSAGQASAPFQPPFDTPGMEELSSTARRARVRRVDSVGLGEVKRRGGVLFESVFTGDVRGCLRASQTEARLQGKTGVRLRLRLGEVPELGVLPWEYLYEKEGNNFLAASRKTPVVRFLDAPEPVRPLQVRPPLRVLVMISSPQGVEALDVEREWENLKSALDEPLRNGLVQLERLASPTIDALRRRLRQERFHIFHFIGHGGFDEAADDGVLMLADEQGRMKPVPAQHLGTVLREEETLQLAVVNACETARGSATDPFSGTAQGLMQRGVPAVVAMQFEISDEAAITFSRELYSALADGYPVDAAVADARQAILTSGNDVEWGTPVLYMRAENGRIFDLQAVDPEELARARTDALRARAKAAADRQEWAAAAALLREVLEIEPADADSATLLERARAQQRWAELYADAVRRRAEEPRLALDLLRRLRESAGSYRDVDVLVRDLERELEPRTPPPPPPPPGSGAHAGPGGQRGAWRTALAAGVVAAVLVGAVVVWIVRDGGGDVVPPPPPPPPLAELYHDSLVGVLDGANRAAIYAWRTGETDTLAAFFADSELRGLVADIANLHRTGFFREDQMSGRNRPRIRSIEPDLSSAVVEMTETWEATERPKNDRDGCRRKLMWNNARQRVTLSRTPDGWRIVAVYNPDTAVTLPCGGE